MNRLFLVIIISFSFAKIEAQINKDIQRASPKVFAQKQSVFSNAHIVNPLIVLSVTQKKDGKKVGFHGFMLANRFWAEAQMGVIYTPHANVALTATIGMEHDEIPIRGTFSLRYSVRKFTTWTLLEYGGSGYFYIHHSQINISDMWALGVLAQRNVGIGPRVDINFKNKMSIWASPAYNPEDNDYRLSLGVSKLF